MKQKVITGREAAGLIPDGGTVALSGFIGFGLAEEVLCAVEELFLETGHPRGINLMSVAGLGGDGKGRGFNHFGHPGMVGRLYTSNLSKADKLACLIDKNAFPAYLIPQGILAEMFRAIAGKKPGVVSKTGLHTFVDPRIEGARANKAAYDAAEKVVEVIRLRGEEYLFYPAFPVDVAVIKGTVCDEQGNLACGKEALRLEQFEMAAAAKSSGGLVIAQVEEIVKSGSIHPKQVVVPGSLIDYVVLAQGENKRQQFAIEKPYEPSWAGNAKAVLEEMEPMEPGIRKVIARRAAREIEDGDFVNLGIGMPDGVSRVLHEEGRIDKVILSVESGVIGGVPAGGLALGAAYNPEAILPQSDMFALYDGGKIDVACLGGAQFDAEGNVNVSKFNGRVTGPGGFINITQNAKKVCFIGSFTAGGLKVGIHDERLFIEKEGSVRKFCREVEQITFSGKSAMEQVHQTVVIVTERAVFHLTPKGLMLTEIAPGIDLEKNILEQMEFRPLISEDLKSMDPALFM